MIAPIPAGMLEAARSEVRAIRIEPELYGYILTLARRTREWPTLLLGASPRVAQRDACGTGCGSV